MGRRPKPVPPPLTRAEQEVFGRFWAAYPPRPLNPRRAAELEFARALEAGVEPEDLVLAAAAYARQVAVESVAPAYRPHARTWLYQERYLDFLPAGGSGGERPDAGGGADHPLWPRFAGLVTPAIFASWIAPLEIEQTPDGLVVTARSAFTADTVGQRYREIIERAMGARIIRLEVGS